MTEPVWGAIFDWDGVIVDSSRHHEESWERLAYEIHKTLPSDHFKKGFGMKNEFIIPNLLNWTQEPAEIHRLSLRKEELYRVVVAERGIQPLPGVLNFLQWLKTENIPSVIGSSTHRLNIQTALDAMKLSVFFKDITSAEDVIHGKPAPDVFLKASRKLGLPPERCVVFEDALVGIQAARAAGIKVVAVTTTHPAHSLTEADFVTDRLDTLKGSFFQKLLGVQDPV
jgi:beta-phosphoglucomutase family hydrolase